MGGKMSAVYGFKRIKNGWRIGGNNSCEVEARSSRDLRD